MRKEERKVDPAAAGGLTARFMARARGFRFPRTALPSGPQTGEAGRPGGERKKEREGGRWKDKRDGGRRKGDAGVRRHGGERRWGAPGGGERISE